MLEPGFYLMDCMDGMKQFPDKFWELALVDPPYGIGVDTTMAKQSGKQYGNAAAPKAIYKSSNWDNCTPDRPYFDELFRISKNQIVWGGNYFDLPPTPCFIVWDKLNGSNGFADCELAWTSYKSAVRKFAYMWNGMLQEDMKNKEQRFHPTQKPIALYKWLLTNYAHKGDKILDTHVGSASSLIACHQLGFQYWGFELDPDYYKAASERLAKAKAQVSLFENLPEQCDQLSL